jgi:hypothetical protein
MKSCLYSSGGKGDIDYGRNQKNDQVCGRLQNARLYYENAVESSNSKNIGNNM